MKWARETFLGLRLTAKYLPAPLHDFSANGTTLGAKKRGNINPPGHFAAEYL
jgi:hypothetical protein